VNALCSDLNFANLSIVVVVVVVEWNKLFAERDGKAKLITIFRFLLK